MHVAALGGRLPADARRRGRRWKADGGIGCAQCISSSMGAGILAFTSIKVAQSASKQFRVLVFGCPRLAISSGNRVKLRAVHFAKNGGEDANAVWPPMSKSGAPHFQGK